MDLVLKGFVTLLFFRATTVRSKGRNLRIKAPMCRALKKLCDPDGERLHVQTKAFTLNKTDQCLYLKTNMVAHRVCGGSILAKNNDGVWASRVSTVTICGT